MNFNYAIDKDGKKCLQYNDNTVISLDPAYDSLAAKIRLLGVDTSEEEATSKGLEVIGGHKNLGSIGFSGALQRYLVYNYSLYAI